MPGESKRIGSPQGGQSVDQPTRRGPRTRSMASKEAEQAAQVHAAPRALSKGFRWFVQSPGNGEGGATGSEVNNEGGGSPSSNECPSPIRTKKPRRVTINEITEEREATATVTTETIHAPPEGDSGEEERVVYYYTQYLCLSLWRAVENCQVWDYRLVRAFCQGPRSFAEKVNEIAQQLGRRFRSNGEHDVTPEDVTRSYLRMFPVTGLFNCCARLWQRYVKFHRHGARSLKRKKPERESDSDAAEHDRFSVFMEGEGPSKKYKHRFLMDPPRIIVRHLCRVWNLSDNVCPVAMVQILSGPEKTGFDGEAEMDE